MAVNDDWGGHSRGGGMARVVIGVGIGNWREGWLRWSLLAVWWVKAWGYHLRR